MIRKLRHGVLFDTDIRDEPRYDRDSLVEFLVRLSDFAIANRTAIAELDINPVLVQSKGLLMLDSLLVLPPGRRSPSSESSVGR
jgi:hypothetical protein